MTLIVALTLLLLVQAPPVAQPQPAPSKPDATAAAPAEPTSQEEIRRIEDNFLRVKRIYVDNFGDDAISKQVQAMIVSTLTDSKRFVITENKEKADAVLKGAGLEKTSQELHSNSESTAAGGAAGGHSGSVSGSWSNGTGSVSGSSSGGFASRSMAIEDSNTTTETINDARVAVRIVDKDGDVLWATTQESKGGKYKGACADVADKVVKQLLHDVDKLRRERNKPSSSGGSGASNEEPKAATN